MQGSWVVPGDTDGDGVITGISFDYTPLDGTGMFKAVDEFGFAKTVEEQADDEKTGGIFSKHGGVGRGRIHYIFELSSRPLSFLPAERCQRRLA